MIEKQSYQEPFSEVDKRKDDEMEIDLMAIFYKISNRGNHHPQRTEGSSIT